ncbi:hypothetical protein AAG906_026421 [Vitis piasezkii]
MTDNDSKRGGIDRQLQGVGNLENTTTNATLQANGTHSRHQNNSTLRRMPCSDSQRVDTFLPMQDIENGDDTPIPPPTLQDCGTPRNVNKNSTQDTIAPAIMDTSETPFDPNNNTSTMDVDSTTGTIVRNYAPLDVEKWVDISESDKVFMMEKLQEKFIIDFTQDHVKKAIEGKMAARYRDHRNKCHKHFKKYPTIALAKESI